MTEAEWLACHEPDPMLVFLRGRATDRKLRLFAVGCCRSIWHLLPNEAARALVEVAERFADGLASEEERATAEGEFTWADWESRGSQDPYLCSLATEAVTQLARESDATFAARTHRVNPGWPEQAYEAARGVSNQVGHTTPLSRRPEEWAKQIKVLRDIFGNPFRPVTPDPAWLTDDVRTIARQMYNSRDFSRMAMLAVALQDAGCDNEDILTHCRGPGPHVRGCWVVDAVLDLA